MIKRPNFSLIPFLVALVIVLIVMIILTWKFELHKLLATVLPILALSGNLDARPNSLQDVCLEKGCVLAAADIINAMDETINPCDGNFFFFEILSQLNHIKIIFCSFFRFLSVRL